MAWCIQLVWCTRRIKSRPTCATVASMAVCMSSPIESAAVHVSSLQGRVASRGGGVGMGGRSAARSVQTTQPAAEQPGHCKAAIKLPGHPQPPTTLVCVTHKSTTSSEMVRCGARNGCAPKKSTSSSMARR